MTRLIELTKKQRDNQLGHEVDVSCDGGVERLVLSRFVDKHSDEFVVVRNEIGVGSIVGIEKIHLVEESHGNHCR